MTDEPEKRHNPAIWDFSPHVRDLLLLDAMGHYYGRSVPKGFDAYVEATGHRPEHLGEYTQTAEGAHYELSRQVHHVLCRRLDEPEFFAEAHALVRWWSSSARRRAKRSGRFPLPPTQGVAFAYFLTQHRLRPDASLDSCYPWWASHFPLLPGDTPPDLPPYRPPAAEEGAVVAALGPDYGTTPQG